MSVPGNRAVRDAVAVDVLVAAPGADPRQRRRASRTLPRSIGRSGYSNVRRHPGIHRQIEVAHHEHQRLEALGEIEGVHRHRVALLHRRRDQHDLLGVAVRQQRRAQDVSLRGAGRQAGRRTHALDVEDHAGHFRVIRQAGELPHQRDARARGRRHRARARPAGADHHADRRDLVLGLDHRVGRLAVRVVPVLLQQLNQRLRQRRRRRDRIPGADRHAGHHAAERGRRIALRPGSCPAVSFIGSTQ